jgi:hypothetical protein
VPYTSFHRRTCGGSIAAFRSDGGDCTNDRPHQEQCRRHDTARRIV